MDSVANGLMLDCVKLRCSLGQNQLVQANAHVQRVEKILQDVMMAESSPGEVEKHPYWMAWRNSIIVKQFIMGGQTDDAIKVSDALVENVKEAGRKP